jgi:hypothetical protein
MLCLFKFRYNYECADFLDIWYNVSEGWLFLEKTPYVRVEYDNNLEMCA